MEWSLENEKREEEQNRREIIETLAGVRKSLAEIDGYLIENRLIFSSFEEKAEKSGFTKEETEEMVKKMEAGLDKLEQLKEGLEDIARNLEAMLQGA